MAEQSVPLTATSDSTGSSGFLKPFAMGFGLATAAAAVTYGVWAIKKKGPILRHGFAGESPEVSDRFGYPSSRVGTPPKNSNQIEEEDEVGRTPAQKVTVICLSGGPLAGKTTAIGILCNSLRSSGFVVFHAPEAATFLMSTGISFGSVVMRGNSEEIFEMQLAVMKHLILVENLLLRFGRWAVKYRQCGRGVVILTDRGIMDSKAYVSPDLWHRLLTTLNLNEMKIRHRYDSAIFLRSCACDKPEFYEATRSSNPARSESADQAAAIDRALLNAYCNIMDHLNICGNEDDFATKMKKVTRAVNTILGTPLPGSKSKSRKFLLSGLPNFPPDVSVVNFQVDITFLSIQHEAGLIGSTTSSSASVSNLAATSWIESRAIRRIQNNHESFTVLRKVRYINFDEVVITERNITSIMYDELISHPDSTRMPLHIERYCFTVGDCLYRIDRFLDLHDGLVLMQLEHDEDSADGLVCMPPFIIGLNPTDVTDKQQYSTSILSLVPSTSSTLYAIPISPQDTA